MGAQGESPSAVFARRLEALRKRRGWTQQELAARVADGGGRLSRGTIAKIESGVRKGGVTLDEAVQLAAALNVPLPILLVPLDSGDVLAVAPNVEVDPWSALGWILGEVPLDNREMSFWNQESAPLRLERQLRVAQDAMRVTELNVKSARDRGDEAAVEQAEAACERAFTQLGRALGLIYDHGLTPPVIPQEWLAEMERRGIEYRRYFATPQEIREFVEWAGGDVRYTPKEEV